MQPSTLCEEDELFGLEYLPWNCKTKTICFVDLSEKPFDIIESKDGKSIKHQEISFHFVTAHATGL